jgi:hypothetical protein
MEKASFFEHNPIKSDEEDLFGRGQLADLIAPFLLLDKNQDSIVFSIESEWGQGKTSLINLIKFRLFKLDPNAIVISFNPWIVGNLSSILESFFLEFAAAVGGVKSNNRTALDTTKRILKLAKFLQPIKLVPGVEPWGTLIESTLTHVGEATSAFSSEISLEGRKREVEDSLQELDRSIVVIIDDIDRLQPEEARIIFQLTKAIANFKRVSYLLAYELEPIKKVLSYNGTYDGARYLEKIVQVKFQIPPITYSSRKSLVHNGIEKVKKYYPRRDSLDTELVKDCVMKISRCKFTPRQLTQALNSLSLLLFKTKGEVFLLDAVVFVFLETIYPSLTALVRKSPHKYIVNYRAEEENFHDVISRSRREKDESQKPRSIFEKEINSISDLSEGNKIRELVDFIFPGLLHDNGNKRGNDVVDARINTKDSLYKLLSFGLKTTEEFSNEEAIRVIKNEERDGIIDHAAINYDFPDWLFYVSNFFESNQIYDPQGLIVKVVEECKKHYLENKSDYFEETADFIISILASTPESERRALLDFCLQEISSLSVTENLVVKILRFHRLWKNGTYFNTPIESQERSYFPVDSLKDAKDKWVNRIIRESKTEEFFSEPDLVGILFRWGQLETNPYENVRKYLVEKIQEKRNALILVRHFYGKNGATGIEELIPDFNILEKSLRGVPFQEDERLGYSKIAEYFRTQTFSNKKKTEEKT